jgi:hypothetical protein
MCAFVWIGDLSSKASRVIRPYMVGSSTMTDTLVVLAFLCGKLCACFGHSIGNFPQPIIPLLSLLSREDTKSVRLKSRLLSLHE